MKKLDKIILHNRATLQEINRLVDDIEFMLKQDIDTMGLKRTIRDLEHEVYELEISCRRLVNYGQLSHKPSDS